MRLLGTSDLHQHKDKWDSLVQACRKEKPDVVAISGDLFRGAFAQLSELPKIRERARAIREAGCEIALTLGNDDNELLIPEMERGDEEGLWHYVCEKKVMISGYSFIGMPFCRDFPFGYKYWVAGEFRDRLGISPVQLCKPLLINERNEFVEIPDLKRYLETKEPLWERLVRCTKSIDDMRRSIWLIHSPPAGFGLDVCHGGDAVGSVAVRRFIEEYGPLIVISGHIHESPQISGQWKAFIGDTLCLQAGQTGSELHYVTVELRERKRGKIMHSVYQKS